MPTLIGELEKITGSPSSVTQVMVRAHTTRITGSALTTDELVPIPVDRQGRFEVPLRPGKAVLVLVHGGRVGEGERFPLLVEEGLGTIASAIKLASDRFDDYELDELERTAADMLASLDKGLVAATRAEVAHEGAKEAHSGAKSAQIKAEQARDKAGEHLGGTEKAATNAAAIVKDADEKLSGYVSDTKKHSESAKTSASESAKSESSAAADATRAESSRVEVVAAHQEVIPLAKQVRSDATDTASHRQHVDGQVDAIDTAFTESVPPYLQPDAPGGLNATYAVQFATANDMVANRLPVGARVLTHGHHAPGDGGSCSYVVVAEATKSYDLAGPAGSAYRPTVSGTLHPRMFGTVNDGDALDNFALQACFDYAVDVGATLIDGQGLTYNIGTANPYEESSRGWAHTGVLMRSGRTIENAAFRTADGSTNGTIPFSVDMIDDGKPTYIRGCSFDGNRDNLSVDDGIGREDGGCHLVHLYNRVGLNLPVESRDFTRTGNVFFEECHFASAYSYGVRPEYIDALVKFSRCTWDVHGIAVQMHATHVVVEESTVSVTNPRTGRVPNPFHEEVEFAHNYTGAKQQRIEIRGVDYYTTVDDAAMFKVHYPPMQNVKWSLIHIEDCTVRGAGQIVDLSTSSNLENPEPTRLYVSKLVVSESSAERSIGAAIRLTALGASVGKTIEVDYLRVDGLSSRNKLSFGTVKIGEIELNDPRLGPAHTFFIDPNVFPVIGQLRINRPRGVLGDSGIIRSSTTQIDTIIIEGGEFTQGGAGTIECMMNDVTIRNTKVHSPSSGMRRFLYPRSSTATLSFQDVLFTSTASTGPLVHGAVMTGGYIHLRNVRHVANVSPFTSVNSLPPENIISEGTNPLISSATP